MISSASTLLLLATLVFNAALVLGAPIRMDTVQPVARAEISTPVVQPVARAAIVDVQDNRRRSLLGRVSRRSARLVSERDVPLSDVVEVREPVEAAAAPAVAARERRYPRRYIHDFYKRDPATSVKETLTYKKTTVHDTPADAAAYEYGVLDNEHRGKKHHSSSGEKHKTADKTGPTVPPGLPTDAPNVSTTVTVSTTIPDAPAASSVAPSPDATAVVVPTLSAVDPAAATPVATTPVASAPVAETPAPGTPTDVPASGSSSVPAEPQSTPVTPVAGTPDATAPNAATPDAGAPAPLGTTSTAAQAVPTDAAPVAPVANPNAPAAGTPTTTTDSSAPTATTTAMTDSSSPTATTTNAAGTTPTADASATSSTTSSAATATATSTTTDVSGAAPTPDATNNTTPDDSPSPSANTPPSRRSVSRRTLAVSGASWASAVRRQLNLFD